MTYPKITLPQLLGQTAAKSPDRPALFYFGAKISYAQLQDHVDRLAAGLQAIGVKPGDRVALLMPNCPQFVIGFAGTMRAGATVTATSAMYTPRENTHQWNEAGATVVIADRRLDPVIKAALPMFHIFAMTCVMISSIEIGGTVVILPRFELRAVLNAIRKHRPTMFHGVPDEYRGETLKAFLVLKRGVTATAEEIIAFCRERMAAYKTPHQVVFGDSLPKSGVGKYLRRALRNL